MDQWANRAHTGARATAARYSCPPQKNNCVPLLLIHSLLSRTSIYLSLTLFLSLTRLYCPLLLVLLLMLLLLLWLSVVGPARVSTLFINCFAPNLYYFDRLRFGLKLKSNARTVCMVLLVSWQWVFVVCMPKKNIAFANWLSVGHERSWTWTAGAWKWRTSSLTVICIFR